MRLVACATAGPRGSPHVDAVESHQLYLPGVPPGPLRCAAARPYECGTNGRLANPAKRTESILLIYLLLFFSVFSFCFMYQECKGASKGESSDE